MDRNTLSAALPNDVALNAMPAPLRKECALGFVESVLDAIKAEDRDLDDWESFYLTRAIRFCVSRMYVASISDAMQALARPEERSYDVPADLGPLSTTHQLRGDIEYARGMLG
jgi:hypothetical protein